MKTYEAVFNEQVNRGVYGISLVENPAMEGHFLTLSKQEEIKLKSINDEKRILLGLVLEPNKLIYRNQGGEEFNIVFSEDTVSKLAHNFIKSGYQRNSSIEHSNEIDGVSFVESWIVEDSKKDKSVSFGLSYPKGSWLVMMKVESDEVWSDYVESGKVRGFSVDALVELKEINNLNMSEQSKSLKEQLEDVLINFGLKKKEVKVDLGEVKSEDGSVTYSYEGEVLETGKVLFVLGEGGERVDLPAGEYKLEDGSVVVLDDGGVVSSVKPMETQPETEQEMNEDASNGELDSKDKEFLNEIKSLLIKFNENLEQESVKLSKDNEVLEGLRSEISKINSEIVKLKEEPAEKVIKNQPTQVVGKNRRSRILQGLKE